jgi:hypothetical protein
LVVTLGLLYGECLKRSERHKSLSDRAFTIQLVGNCAASYTTKLIRIAVKEKFNLKFSHAMKVN